MTSAEIWMLVANLLIALGTIAAVIISIVAVRKTPEIKVQPQPLEVKVFEELGKQFAGKKEFDSHVRGNTERHGQLFNKIDAVERQARAELDRRFEELALERLRNIKEINEKFTDIQVNIGCIKTELDIRNELP